MADMLSTVVDGGIILSKVPGNRGALPGRVMLYRAFIRAIFLGTEPPQDAAAAR